jgi:F-type H+-transporting ATPase subunit b
MAFYLVNFLIFVWLMRKFTKAPLRDFLASRRKELVEAMAEATKAKAEADRVKKEYEEKVAGLEAARTELIAEIRGIAESDREHAIQSADEASARLMADVERTAESDLERARLSLRAEADDAGIDLTKVCQGALRPRNGREQRGGSRIGARRSGERGERRRRRSRAGRARNRRETAIGGLDRAPVR